MKYILKYTISYTENMIWLPTIVMLFACLSLNAKTLSLRSVTMTLEPMTSTMQRIDANGSICGLVKVIVPGKNIVFEGNLVGDSEYKTSEYWCYLSPNTRFLKIKYPDLEPLMVDFNEFFTNGIQSKRIYEIVLDVTSISNKIGTPIEVKINSSRSMPFWGMDAIESGLGRKKNPSWRVGNDTIGSIQVYLNLKNGKYDEKVITTTGRPTLIGNVTNGDVLTLVPQNDTFKETHITVNDTVIDKQHVSITMPKQRLPIRGKVVDITNNNPIQDAIVKLHYVNDASDYLHPWTQKKYGETICADTTNHNGSFGFLNCVCDYTYYIEVRSPSGYHSRYVTNGIDVEPDKIDSLFIELSPICLSGVITDGKNPIKEARIKYLALYDDQTATNEEGVFNIRGIKDKNITINAPGFKTLELDISDYIWKIPRDPEWEKTYGWLNLKPIVIKLQKGDSSVIQKGVYEYYKDQIRKRK